MIARRLDDRMKRLLWEIRKGKNSFGWDGGDDYGELDKDIKCLIKMTTIGLIDYKDLKLSENRRGKGPKYAVAIVNGLTYDGELEADDLELAPVADSLREILSYQGLQACRCEFDRALTRVVSDPAQAIASASSTLESICKEILARAGRELPRNKSIQPLIAATMKAVDLAPESAAEAEIKRILGAVGNIAAAIGTLRTNYGAAHGRTDEHTPLTPMHARFAINSMAAVALFLLEIALDKESR